MNHWQHILRTNIRSVTQLCDFLELQPTQRKTVIEKKRFGLNIPLRLAKKMTKGTLSDPLFLQFVPQESELIHNEAYIKDPVEDCSFRRSAKLLTKYQGRALLLASSACAMHCRYCFRQHFDYASTKEFSQELAYIQNDTSLKEVILSGGDPLSLSNDLLFSLIQEVESIKHITRIRFHSRFLIGVPERVDEGFLNLFRKTRLQFYFVLHYNHPRELDEDIVMAIRQLQKEGVVFLNQAVLLKGVNDSLETLEALAESCIDHGIIPYYLHQLDRVEGTTHFEVDRETGKRLVEELRSRTSGFGQFRYVEEIPHALSKTSI
jgi:EF-P beta-lysylation protein EpmB